MAKSNVPVFVTQEQIGEAVFGKNDTITITVKAADLIEHNPSEAPIEDLVGVTLYLAFKIEEPPAVVVPEPETEDITPA